MPEKINKKQETKTNSDVYEIYLGTFNEDVFTWYSIKKLKDPVEAYKEFKKYVNTQLKYTDEELKKVWDTGRLDIELRKGSKLLNWVGIYSREVKELSKEEEKEVEEGKIKKAKKDSAVTPSEIFKKFYYDPSEIIHDSDDYYYAYCDEIQFFINTKKGERVPTDKYDFGATLENIGLSIESLETYSASVDSAYNVLTKVGKFIVDHYLPNHDFKFNDIDLSYGATVAIKFLNPQIVDESLNVIDTYKSLRINYKKPYTQNEDLWYKTTGETFAQTFNKIPRQNDSVNDKYALEFHVKNNLKYSVGEQEFVEDIGKDESILSFSSIPSQREVESFFEYLATMTEDAFNEANEVGPDEYQGRVEFYITNIKLLDFDYNLIKEYPDLSFSFFCKN